MNSLNSQGATTTDKQVPSLCNQYFAKLMNPVEVGTATLGCASEVHARTSGKWALCGDAAPGMFARMNSPELPPVHTRLSGFTSPSGYGYAVITHQIEGFQHRWVLCLYDPLVRQFLAAMAHEGVSFLFGNDEGNDCLLLDSPIGPREFLPLLAMAPDATREQQIDALAELPAVVMSLGSLWQIPTLKASRPVIHVSMSLLVPAVFVECAESALLVVES
ncbi:MAG: hypothetical protein KDH18_02575 [Rhodoferax sp.]|nr:hypothetical protein [Rhodoferax sp.]MCB2027651.1 hypothetical protein [Rhodoferax sp.]